MKNVLTLANLKAVAIMIAFAATVAAVAPSIKISVETNQAKACNPSDPGCRR